MTTVRVAFFTAGTTGAGHVVRALAIQRALARRGSPAIYAVFAPKVPFRMGAALTPGLVREVPVDEAELRDRERAKDSELARALRTFAPDVLIVDLFWAPLLHILPLASCEAWLLVRSVPEVWLVGPPGHAYDRGLFARVIAIEPGAGAGRVDETIDPIVMVNPDEARPHGALRAALGLGEREPLVVVHQAGEPGEWATLVDRGASSAVHAFTFAREGAAPEVEVPARVCVHDGGAFFPLAEWLSGADALVSGAGYNSYWESRWVGYAARTRFAPFARQIDDQAWRLRACAAHEMRANGADVLAGRLR